MAKVYLISISERGYLPTKEGKQFLYHNYVFSNSSSVVDILNIGDLEKLLASIKNKILMFDGKIPKVIFQYFSKQKKAFENFLRRQNCIIASYDRDTCFIKNVKYHFIPSNKELYVIYSFFNKKNEKLKTLQKNNNSRFYKKCKRKIRKRIQRKVAA